MLVYQRVLIVVFFFGGKNPQCKCGHHAIYTKPWNITLGLVGPSGPHYEGQKRWLVIESSTAIIYTDCWFYIFTKRNSRLKIVSDSYLAHIFLWNKSSHHNIWNLWTRFTHQTSPTKNSVHQPVEVSSSPKNCRPHCLTAPRDPIQNTVSSGQNDENRTRWWIEMFFIFTPI